MNIGLMIAKERTKRNMSKRKLAKLIGCTERAVEYWESGERNISLKYLDNILKVFNMTMKIGYESDLII
ncbi:helix-turn-helix domain-containing protein [Clostridium peptidivorans]|uniref:helix-turn-helix domain-containing protein n=1 Tax=Clostridium peptidivorans TaxID=100174 RepID=UPI000BE27F02|nr:helix-turn-helix transcriptional regulator [Clostridium peptidivorans]